MAARDAKSVVRRMLLTGFCLVALLTPILNSGAQGQPLSRGTIVYGTVVERDSGRDARVPNAVLSFLSSNGATTEAKADETGDYSTDLPSGERYSLTVTSRGFCPAHRPPFDAQPDRKIKFDVMLTTACPKDLVEVSGEDSPSKVEAEFCARAGVYYCEENLPMSVKGNENLIIGFGKREKTGHLLKYDPTPIRGHAGAEIPVTISFGTYTLQAHQASLDEKLKMLRAEGNVSIADGSSSPPRLVPCAIIRLNDPEPQVRPCPEYGTLDPKTGNQGAGPCLCTITDPAAPRFAVFEAWARWCRHQEFLTRSSDLSGSLTRTGPGIAQWKTPSVGQPFSCRCAQTNPGHPPKNEL